MNEGIQVGIKSDNGIVSQICSHQSLENIYRKNPATDAIIGIRYRYFFHHSDIQ